MLELRNVTVRYSALTIVDKLSFKLEPGQWLMLVGPNGAGKSTVVNAISQGAPYQGDILVNGENVKSLKAAERARRLGVLDQNHQVGYAFTVREVVRLGRYCHAQGLLRGNNAGDEEAIARALALTGLSDIAAQSTLTLSGGELQRVFLAQLFAQDPPLLILDEPTNHLDLIYQRQIFDLLQQWLAEGRRAVVSVVHDLSLARAYGSHGLLLHQGQAKANGEIQTTLTRANLESVYGLDVYQWMRDMLGQWEDEHD